PFCTCMGATFPLGLFVLRSGGSPGAEEGFRYLYLANVVGAAMGTLVTAFVLVELLGFAGTLSLAAVGNATIAALALVLSLKATTTAAPASMPESPREEVPAAAASSRAMGPVRAALFATGLSSMGIE